MKPIAIFQHSPLVEPGYFASFLARHAHPWELIRIDQGEPLPADPHAYAGLAFMGGVMSVNDPLPWIEPVLALIRAAREADIPVVGHCLGGQLMARAFGGEVVRAPVPEIGWAEVHSADNPIAHEWLGKPGSFPAFHWHHDRFTLPEGASLLLSSQTTPNQAFVLGPHLGMQCHIEMTEGLIQRWNRAWHAQPRQSAHYASVQPTALQLAQTPRHLPVMRALAHSLYERWYAGLTARVAR